jgi:hypothetical protein
MKDATNRLHVAKVLNCSNTNNLSSMVITEGRGSLRDLIEDQLVHPEQNKSLSLDLDELSTFLSIRKELSENISKFGLQKLENLKALSICHPQGLRTSVQSQKFVKLLSVVRRSQGGSGKADKNQPKLMKLKEILDEHFQRRARGQTSTKVMLSFFVFITYALLDDFMCFT